MQVTSCLGCLYTKYENGGAIHIGRMNCTQVLSSATILPGYISKERGNIYKCSLHFLCLETAKERVTKIEASCDMN